MAENGTIFKTRTYDFVRPFNEPKQPPKSKCAYIEGHARMLPAAGVKVVTPDVVILCKKKAMAREGSEEPEYLIYLLIYSNKFPYLQIIKILVCGGSPPKSHEQGYLNFYQKP